MAYEIDLGDQLPAGHALKASRGGEHIPIEYQGFLTHDDGEAFISRLEGWPTDLLNRVSGASLNPATIDHFVAIIRKNGKTTVYVNELERELKVEVNRSVRKGAPVLLDDIVDVTELSFRGIELPAECGLIVVLSVGWRKFLHYDYFPLLAQGGPRTYRIEAALGQYYSYLWFSDLVRLEPSEWDRFLNDGWFPFAYLRRATIRTMISHVRSHLFSLDELTHACAADTAHAIEWALPSLRRNPAFQPHMPVVERAINRYMHRDYISCVSILYPRIEGIMRTYHMNTNPDIKAKESTIIATATRDAKKTRHEYSLLVPRKFHRYLERVVFKNFDDSKPVADTLSRHSVSHGVADSSLFGLKQATTAILTLFQLSLCLRPLDLPATKPEVDAEGAE